MALWSMWLMTCHESLAAPKGAGEEKAHTVKTKVIKVITRDDTGKPLKFPSEVFYDDTMGETYVIAGGNKGIIVYSSSYFPVAVLGKGRGVDRPTGLFVDRSGLVYVCESGSRGRAPRISVFNAAFFKVKDILFDGIQGAEDFVPRTLSISPGGMLYVVGNARGVLVLKPDGTFSHWLTPKDRLPKTQEMLEEDAREAGDNASASAAREEAGDVEGGGDIRGILPEELLPSTGKEGEGEVDDDYYMGPVQVQDVEIDSEGHIYVLSEETSKVYVFSSSEEFLFSFGQKGGSSGKMSRPQALAIDEGKKCVFITDYMRHTVLLYDLSGKFMYEFGGYGIGPGWFQYPKGIALDRKGNVIIADFFNQRVQVISLRFKNEFILFGAGVSGKNKHK